MSDKLTQVQVYESTMVALRQRQLKMADKDGKIPPLRDVLREIVEGR